MTGALSQRFFSEASETARTSSCESVSRRGDENARAARLAPHTLIAGAGFGAVVVAREKLAVIDPELVEKRVPGHGDRPAQRYPAACSLKSSA